MISRSLPKQHRPGSKLGPPILSTHPFADGYPWDEELIRAGRRALSTHGPSWREHPNPLHAARASLR